MSDIAKGFLKALVGLLVLFFLFYIIRYNIITNKGFSEVNYDEIFENEKNQYEEIKIDLDSIGQELYEKVNFKLIETNFGKDFFDNYYITGIDFSKNVNSDLVVFLAIINLKKDSFMDMCNNSVNVLKSDVDDEIKKLFGTIKYDDVLYKEYDNGLIIEYDDSNNLYKVTNIRCSGIEFGDDYIESELYKVENDNGNIVITEIVYYVSYSFGDNGNYFLNYHYGFDKDSPIIATSKDDKFNKEKFLKYKYIFEKKDDNYYLIKIES